ncbi:alpha/beta hydrolase [Pedobacter sp. LMG 31464]|uniref:Alpha/beta hydrolase n=1 Tax=Pedobacter planticolens TaxID=2679964 RepID=A0A923IVJ8_9SPHI|nr:alpha/beta hydrolase-fold protein [Pedobacter planticolens]MBB2146101.1 alpha/beta hydrolase [Pedobacter planticolens]
MKKLILSILTAILSLGALAQKDNKVTIGTIDSIQSKILNEQRKIWVYVPSSWNADSKQRYPVVYLLDGDAHFYSVVGMIQQLSQVNGNTISPEMIVVGIPNTDRTRDLTPTHVDADPPFIDSASSKTSGGGERFVSFIEKELMPRIDSLYSTQPYKMLIGHSLGGLTVMNVAINHTKLFNSYICIDPSMWWDKMNLLNTTKKSLREKNFSGTTLYLGIANTMNESMDITKVRSDTSIGTKHIRSILDLDKNIKDQKQNGLRYESKYYSNDDHGSVPLIAEYDAFRFIFSKYRFKLSFKDFTDPTVDLVNKFEKHYQEVSKLFGYKLYPPENMINGLGYECLQRNQYPKAGGLFKLNVDNYPESFNVYDSYGDYFLAIGDKPKAIECFKKSLSIQENTTIREKLNKTLQGK